MRWGFLCNVHRIVSPHLIFNPASPPSLFSLSFSPSIFSRIPQRLAQLLLSKGRARHCALQGAAEHERVGLFFNRVQICYLLGFRHLSFLLTYLLTNDVFNTPLPPKNGSPAPLFPPPSSRTLRIGRWLNIENRRGD